MIIKRIIPALLLSVAFAASAQAAEDFSGTWSAQTGEGGSHLWSCSFTQRDSILSGTCDNQMPGHTLGAATGRVDADNVKWTWVAQIEGRTIRREFSGLWDAKDMLVAQMAGAMNPEPIIYKRTPAK